MVLRACCFSCIFLTCRIKPACVFLNSLTLLFILHWPEAANTENSLYSDLLLPYPHSWGHGPRHSHRHVRDCQPVIFGNVTHETWISDKTTDFPVAVTNVFVSVFPTTEGGKKSVHGHMTVINNPLHTVSVLEPGEPEGCIKRRTATVEETARPRKCLVAQNGGYFDTSTNECLGNVVSDGKLVRNSKGIQNAQFGIRKDGTLVFGYLSEDDVLDQKNPFVQLISGVIWLLRNGTIYVNESKKAECEETQETGKFEKFINVVSARTAVGHNKEGKLILFHMDGQTNERGLSLWEVAKFLQEQGVVNAINLDGGGSATLVINGSLASYPSDHCSNPMWRCPRKISTVLCVHEPPCDPEDCSGHGVCVYGKCQCTEGWKGPSCNSLDCQPSFCDGHGYCSPSGCVCNAGWMGANCSDECPLGFYGQSCKNICECEHPCLCHPETGKCNASYLEQMKRTLHRTAQCLDSQSFHTWKKTLVLQKQTFNFSETVWITITSALGLGFLTIAIVNLICVCRKFSCVKHDPYSYYALNEVNNKIDNGEYYKSAFAEWTDKGSTDLGIS
ncbi:N-acetylglucosamine-1-phosphodiester alpha-N-acetylglucosaminidase isoform X1 [Polypterus senegalus]|uniref:N-acetylglucosamine-1-phosphodiester alpha-N-acetylglucosaminidase isoform X1 n=1 Tax=Polypterus senegalus TaxID=55291 RepID=UPI001965C5C8|nr:N-acetylglucosamine-1-phosphodiester alpha-N-acetylglucosaminidase isoform X1 [Polypterus senegalus]